MMTDLERGPSSDGTTSMCASSLNKPSSQEGLKPCPFCGIAPRAKAVRDFIFISCENDECPVGCETSANTLNEASEAWNTRHPSFNDAIEAWQPIETAPKDGSDVLLYFPLKGLSEAWPNTIIGHWRQPAGQSRGDWVWQARAYYGYSNEYQPTYWRPLPTPPRSLKLPDYRGGEAKTAESGDSPSTLNAETE